MHKVGSLERIWHVCSSAVFCTYIQIGKFSLHLYETILRTRLVKREKHSSYHYYHVALMAHPYFTTQIMKVLYYIAKLASLVVSEALVDMYE